MENFASEVLYPVLNNISSFSERNAFLIDEKYYTYREFGIIISEIRAQLQLKNGQNQNVGLVINDDILTYASIFALWLEGKAYVPLHPGWPNERVLGIVEQVGLDVILDSSKNSRYDEAKVIHTNKSNGSKTDLTPKAVSDEENAYILFTSGSTGIPKGVQLSRHNLASFMDSLFKGVLEMNEEDRCLQCFDLSFDLSIMSYLASLVKGACVYTVPSSQIKYSYIASLIEDYKLTVALMAPSTIRYLQPYFDEIDASSLKYSLFCGEALHENITAEWAKCATNAIIKNVYGPTEDTIFCTEYVFNREGNNKSHNGVLSIGKSMVHNAMEIFDEAGNVITDSEPGELFLSGEQLTKGYWNNPEKNKEVFFFKDGIRWYHTGDICFKDGEDIMYVGRLDGQAKIQGFRVELGEIDYHAREFSGVNCVALAYDNNEQLTEIALFVEKDTENTSPLISYMRTKMPSYMIPSKIYYVNPFPLNTNGKTDKKELRKLINENE